MIDHFVNRSDRRGPTLPAVRSRREIEQQREADEKSTVWAFVWTLFAFKIVTIVATFWAAAGSFEAGMILLATNWFWLVIPVFAVAGPLAFHYRLRKARRRRLKMVRSEWMID
jgi:FtsH-binding integral membrane protein